MSLSHIGCLHISLSHVKENTNENVHTHWVTVKIGINCLDPDLYRNKQNLFYFYWVTVKIGINGLDPDLYRNKHRINPEYVEID